MAYHMNKHIISILLTLIFSLTLLPATLVHADAAERVSKQQAVNIAQQSNPGRVLSVKLDGSVYRVKTLNDKGEVRIILVDANSGKIITE